MQTLPQPRAAPYSDSLSVALERMVQRFSCLIRKVAWQHSLSDSDVDELIQDVRIRLWRSLSSGEKIEKAPASYVYRTAVSAALDLIRRRRARREDPVEVLPNGEAGSNGRGPDRELADTELVDVIEEVLTTLHKSRRPVVRMHLVGYHRKEIARLMGWTEAKTRNLLYRGLGDLRQELKGRGVSPGAFV